MTVHLIRAGFFGFLWVMHPSQKPNFFSKFKTYFYIQLAPIIFVSVASYWRVHFAATRLDDGKIYWMIGETVLWPGEVLTFFLTGGMLSLDDVFDNLSVYVLSYIIWVIGFFVMYRIVSSLWRRGKITSRS